MQTLLKIHKKTTDKLFQEFIENQNSLDLLSKENEEREVLKKL